MTSQAVASSARRSPADEAELGAWRAFIQTHARLLHRLDEELQAAHGLSIAEYDALLQLVTAPERRLRMSALADRVLLSRSGITRLVDRLVADGMVERSACPRTRAARGRDPARPASLASAPPPRRTSRACASTSSTW
ncbi:MAG: MarR family transcriptional regulator [Chloroflexota bacterium]